MARDPGSPFFRRMWLQSNPAEFFARLFGELPQYNSDYMRQILNGAGVVVKNGALYNDDYATKYANVRAGLRCTTDQPREYENTVYLLGPSFVYGLGAEDAHTMASYLQRLLNVNLPGRFIVHNFGVKATYDWNNVLQLRSLSLKSGDIVFSMLRAETLSDKQLLEWHALRCLAKGAHFFPLFRPYLYKVTRPSSHEAILCGHRYEKLANNTLRKTSWQGPSEYMPSELVRHCRELQIPHCDLQPFFNRPHDMGEVFFDRGHWNYKGNEACAKVMLDLVLTCATEPTTGGAVPEWLRNVEADTLEALEGQCLEELFLTVRKKYGKDDIKQYIQGVKNAAFSRKSQIGAIVMNANPFTKGHKYLIARALRHVNALYVFVVENNESAFSFEDRMRLVKEGTRAFGNKVHVVPSGNFIISSFTFPEYFTKETRPVDADSSLDIIIFGAIIAPALRIKTRFVGEEPNCRVTLSYNRTMEEYLPRLNIDLRVIPRTQIGERVISASHVRKMLDIKDISALRAYVPASTYIFLRARAGLPEPLFPDKFQRVLSKARLALITRAGLDGLFPNKVQRVLLKSLCEPYIKMFAKPNLRAKYMRDPGAFLADSPNSGLRAFSRFLGLFGREP